jgi:hypothetical protein
MAKWKNLSKKRHEVGRTIVGPSPFGSHREMVVDHSSFDLTLDDNQVLCKDGDNHYVTTKDRLDNGLADPRRYSSKQLVLTVKEKKDG